MEPKPWNNKQHLIHQANLAYGKALKNNPYVTLHKNELEKRLEDANSKGKGSGYVAAVGALHNAIHKGPSDCLLCQKGWARDTQKLIMNIVKLIDELRKQ